MTAVVNREKIRRNFVSAAHAATTCVLYSAKIGSTENLVARVSLLYFIWDTVYIMAQEKMEYGYLYHHALAIHSLLRNDIPSEIVLYILFVSEFSNLPGYYVYHQLKLGKDPAVMRVVQFLWFSYFRMYKYIEIIVMYYIVNREIIAFQFWAIFAFSLAVWHKQLKKISEYFYLL